MSDYYIYPGCSPLPPCFISDYSIDQPVAAAPPMVHPLGIAEVEKEHTMSCYDDDCDCCSPSAPQSDESKQRSYLSHRMSTIAYEKRSALEEQFFLNVKGPKTLQELSDWLKSGHFTIEGLDKNPETPVGLYWRDVFSWRTQPADRAGFQKACAVLDTASQAAQDAAALAPIADATAAMKTFETWTYTA
jgi:hypothetical protein